MGSEKSNVIHHSSSWRLFFQKTLEHLAAPLPHNTSTQTVITKKNCLLDSTYKMWKTATKRAKKQTIAFLKNKKVKKEIKFSTHQCLHLSYALMVQAPGGLPHNDSNMEKRSWQVANNGFMNPKGIDVLLFQKERTRGKERGREYVCVCVCSMPWLRKPTLVVSDYIDIA